MAEARGACSPRISVIQTGILAGLAQLADEEHVAVELWLTGLGITRAQIDDAAARVSYRQASLIIKRALRAIPRSDIGLKVGTQPSIGSFGIMSLAMMIRRGDCDRHRERGSHRCADGRRARALGHGQCCGGRATALR